MCAGCMSHEQSGSMGHEGIAMAESTKFDGLGATSKKFEGEAASTSGDAAEAERTGWGA